MNNGYEKRVRWMTVSQQGKFERHEQQQAGHKAQRFEHQWRRWHIALRRMHWACTYCFTVLDHHTHIHGSSSERFSPPSMVIHMVVSLWLDLLHSLLLSLPLVCPLLPPQRRAAAGALLEGHGKPVRLRYQRGVDTYEFLYHTERGCMQRFTIEGATRRLQIFGEDLRRLALTKLFYFVADRSFTADGGLL